MKLKVSNRKLRKKAFVFFLLIFPFSFCFGQSDSILIAADHYKTKNFDVAIFPSNSKDLISGARFTPTRKEIDEAESALKLKLKELNKNLINQSSTPIIHENLKKYKRQYFGFKLENGQRILFINCFWEKDEFRSKGKWLKEFIMVFDGGSFYWQVKYNLDTKELFELEVNGYA